MNQSIAAPAPESSARPMPASVSDHQRAPGPDALEPAVPATAGHGLAAVSQGATARGPATIASTGSLALAAGAGIACGVWGPAGTVPVIGFVGSGLLVPLAVVVLLSRSAVAPMFGALGGAGVVAAGLIAIGLTESQPVVAGLGGLAVVILFAAIVLAAGGRASGVGAGASSSAVTAVAGAGAAAPVPTEIVEILRRLDEHIMLSDNARRVLFRERELQLLDRAIEDDIRAGKWDVALTLCDQLADVFGERERAEAYRSRVLESRDQRYASALQASLDELDALLEQRRWQSAHDLAARIQRLYGEAHQVQDLGRRFQVARQQHKMDLERAFLEAAGKDDTEHAMRILREMDHYLSREEAAQFSEVASGVIKQHRENLGVQFKLAVNDHRWAQAAEIGRTIVSEFPNSKMAVEVQSMIELLDGRARGTVQPGAGPGAGPGVAPEIALGGAVAPAAGVGPGAVPGPGPGPGPNVPPTTPPGPTSPAGGASSA